MACDDPDVVWDGIESSPAFKPRLASMGSCRLESITHACQRSVGISQRVALEDDKQLHSFPQRLSYG